MQRAKGMFCFFIVRFPPYQLFLSNSASIYENLATPKCPQFLTHGRLWSKPALDPEIGGLLCFLPLPKYHLSPLKSSTSWYGNIVTRMSLPEYTHDHVHFLKLTIYLATQVLVWLPLYGPCLCVRIFYHSYQVSHADIGITQRKSTCSNNVDYTLPKCCLVVRSADLI